MGKSLSGKVLEKGITQRKDGIYSARFISLSGKRHEKHFKIYQDAIKWLKTAKLEDEIDFTGVPNVDAFGEYTVDQWYHYWIDTFKSRLSPNTLRNYRDRYLSDVKPRIGNVKVRDVRPMHCQQIFNSMYKDYANGTMYQTYIMLGSMFKSALKNGLIRNHPFDAVEMPASKDKKDIHYLTVEEQAIFEEEAGYTDKGHAFSLILQTGLRTSELIGLTFDCVDFDKREIKVEKQLEYRYSEGYWRAGPPKTKNSYRTIPMTSKAYAILKAEETRRHYRKESDTLDQELQYHDTRSGTTKVLKMRDLVFISQRTGEPVKNSTYDTALYKICDRAGLKPFCMHALRHTFATRCIERGVQPKVLQKILGHAQLSTTMDLYVHVTDESLAKGMEIFESAG